MPVAVPSSGELAALLTREMLVEVLPLDCGVKTTESEALWPAVKVSGNVAPLRTNSGLPLAAEEMVTLAPVAITVCVRLSLLPTVTLPKLNVAGESESCPAEVPVPLKEMAWLERPVREDSVTAPMVLPLD